MPARSAPGPVRSTIPSVPMLSNSTTERSSRSSMVIGAGPAKEGRAIADQSFCKAAGQGVGRIQNRERQGGRRRVEPTRSVPKPEGRPARPEDAFVILERELPQLERLRCKVGAGAG